VDVLPCRQGPIPFDPSKVIVTPLAAWAGDAPAGSLAVPDAAASFTDPRKDRNRNPVPARDRILNWLHANPGSDLTAVDIMDYGLADSRDVKSARLLLWRMDQAGEIAVTIRGVRGRTANHYGLPARS
jgi:hypothetical protein